jgi:hypothetical protein
MLVKTFQMKDHILIIVDRKNKTFFPSYQPISQIAESQKGNKIYFKLVPVYKICNYEKNDFTFIS